MALSLYRKYRPEVFSDVIGQEHVEKTLINAMSEGAVSHAYLFCGPRGTGKTTTARLLAKALLCESPRDSQPDGSCPQCVEISQGAHPDVFELDAASRTGVDNVREEIIGRVGFSPTRGRYKIYIIDEVHMLTTAAFNALLKTLEEPPEHVVFVLCTTDPHKVPDTIQSRCQRFDFRRFSVEEIIRYLERICTNENFEFEPDALELIAAKSAGGMRDATTALEQVAVFTEGKITLDEASRMFGQIDAAALFEIGAHIARRDTPACFVWINDLVGKGVDLSQFARDLAAHLRNVYVTAITGGDDGIVACTAAQLQQYREQAQQFGGVDRLARALDVCGALVTELRNSSDPRLSVEIAMTRLTRPDSELTLDALAERIEMLELRGPIAASQAAPVQQVVPAPMKEELPSYVEPMQKEAGLGPASRDDAVVEEQPTNDTAPAAQPEEAVADSAASSRDFTVDISNMSLERLLSAILVVIRREDEALAGLLDGISLELDDGEYHILFPSDAAFQMQIAGNAKETKVISQAFSEVLGQDVKFSCRIGSFVGSGSQQVEGQSAFYEDDAIDGAYYDSLASSESFDEPAGDRLDASDPLAVFGAGVKVREIHNEE